MKLTKAEKREKMKRKKRKMKVSGNSVKYLYKIIKEKNEPYRTCKKSL